MKATYTPTAKGYFTGIGGMEIGMKMAGINIIQSLEIDKGATSILSANKKYFDHKIVTMDIKDIMVTNQEETDVVIGTYPCDRYSTIADIHGARTGDDLYLHFFRHIALELPEAYVLENVPGMRKFPVVMEAMTKLPQYYVTVLCPVNSLNWLPQRRERVIIIGTKKPFSVTAPSLQRKISLKDIIEKDPVYDIPDYVKSRINGGYRDLPIIVDPSDRDSFAPTCVAHYSKDQGTRMVKCKSSAMGVRPFTVREYARLQGFPDDFVFPTHKNGSAIKKNYMYIGNAVPVPMGKWAGEQLMRYFNN